VVGGTARGHGIAGAASIVPAYSRVEVAPSAQGAQAFAAVETPSGLTVRLFPETGAVLFRSLTGDQAETDRLGDTIVGNGGQESMCGWCKDKWGVSWQVTPRRLLALTTDPDQAKAQRAMESMMTMRKIDVAAIEAAIQGVTGHA